MVESPCVDQVIWGPGAPATCRLIASLGMELELPFSLFFLSCSDPHCRMAPTPHQWDHFFGQFASWNDAFWKYPHGSISLSGHSLALSSQHFKLAILPDITASRPADSRKMRAIKSWVVFFHTSKIWGLFLSTYVDVIEIVSLSNQVWYLTWICFSLLWPPDPELQHPPKSKQSHIFLSRSLGSHEVTIHSEDLWMKTAGLLRGTMSPL